MPHSGCCNILSRPNSAPTPNLRARELRKLFLLDAHDRLPGEHWTHSRSHRESPPASRWNCLCIFRGFVISKYRSSRRCLARSVSTSEGADGHDSRVTDTARGVKPPRRSNSRGNARRSKSNASHLWPFDPTDRLHAVRRPKYRIRRWLSAPRRPATALAHFIQSMRGDGGIVNSAHYLPLHAAALQVLLQSDERSHHRGHLSSWLNIS